jgi:hypothetical protein
MLYLNLGGETKNISQEAILPKYITKNKAVTIKGNCMMQIKHGDDNNEVDEKRKVRTYKSK